MLQSLSETGFSAQPLSVLQDEQTRELGVISSLAMLENAPQESVRVWQTAQLNNLTGFARQFSPFWQARLPAGKLDAAELSKLPSLTREQLVQQVQDEGPLSRHAPQLASSLGQTYASSGSTGVPVQTFSLTQNARFNELRSLAQYIMEGRRLDLNRTFIKPAGGQQIADGQGVRVEIKPSWLGSLGGLFAAGHYKTIHADFDAAAIARELRLHPVGYLACLGSHMEALVQSLGDEIAQLGIHMWLHHSDDRNPSLVAFLLDRGIVTRSSYSCAELGPIATECPVCAERYHVVNSNVLVQGGETVAVSGLDGRVLEVSNLLVTHLHSYATPLIRYEVGDSAVINESCPCGHQGTTLSHIRGRRKNFVRASDGTWVFLPIFSKPLSDLAPFKAFFFEQLEPGRVLLWWVPADELSAHARASLVAYLRGVSRADLDFEIRLTDHIDWSHNPKRVPFICRL